MTKHTDVELREKLVRSGINDAVFLELSGGTRFTAEQADLVHRRILEAREIVLAHVDTAELEFLMFLRTRDVMADVLGSKVPSNPGAWVMELAAAGAASAGQALKAGGYAEPTPEQVQAMSRAFGKRASVIMHKGLSIDRDAALGEMADLGHKAVEIMCGDAPIRSLLN
ncbi:hypothetical protein F0U61_32500 [Archangium violaceum]|uniref:hypothetical protein n=1 Tax=Archangium violaceum TaxID=83451 RepID=UPI002B2AB54B|nr:hypothetical protein F0U61_32500 [Archangium violaceum]